MAKILKLRIDDADFIPLAMKVLTRKVIKEVYLITTPDGKITTRKTKARKDEKMIKDLRKIGYRVTTRKMQNNTRVRELAGIPVKIEPIKRSYTDGIRISVELEGKTSRTMNKDYECKLQAITEFMNMYGIPVGKVCQEALVGCDGE